VIKNKTVSVGFLLVYNQESAILFALSASKTFEELKWPFFSDIWHA
jgi:hypothetical protein